MLEPTIDHNVSALVDLIRREGVNKGPIDIAEIASYFTVDVLTHVAFGAPVGDLTRNEDVYSYLRKVSDFLVTIELGANISLIQTILSSVLLRPLRPKPTDKTGMGAMLGLAKRVAEERFSSHSTTANTTTSPRNDMLDSFIRNGLTQQEVESESLLTIVGGSDSSATAIRMTFLFILTNPRVHTALLHELAAARPPPSRLAHPVIPSAQAQRLPYLQACIKEGLRMFPPVTGLQGKLSPPEGLRWGDDVFIPGGVEVCWCPLSMQRRTDVFGADADIFRPERWIEAEVHAAIEARGADGGEVGSQPLSEAKRKPVNGNDVEGATQPARVRPGTTNPKPPVSAVAKLTRMNQTLDLLFGHGKYSCLGKMVAQMELDKVFVALFENFEFGLVSPWAPVKSVSHAIHVQSDMWVRVSTRK